MQPEDIQVQIDDINTNIEDISSSLSDLGDNIDQNNSDQDDINNDIETRMSTTEENSGQLLFPLTQDTIDLITEQTPAMLQYMYNNNYIGTSVLVGGTKTISNNIITANSLVFLSRATLGGTPGHLSYTVSAGSLVINSSSATDTSTIIWFILIP